MLKNPNTPEDKILSVKRMINQLEDQEDRSFGRVDNSEDIEELEKELNEEVNNMTRLYIEGRRNGYAPYQCGRTMTVGELRDYLEQFEDDIKIYLINDNGYTYGSIDYDSFSSEEIDDEEESDEEEEVDESLESAKGYIKKQDVSNIKDLIRNELYNIIPTGGYASVYGANNIIEYKVWSNLKEKGIFEKYPSNLYSIIREVMFEPEFEDLVRDVEEKKMKYSEQVTDEDEDNAKNESWEDNELYRQHIWVKINENDRDKIVSILGKPHGEGDWEDDEDSNLNWVMDYYFDSYDKARDFSKKIPSDIVWDVEELDESVNEDDFEEESFEQEEEFEEDEFSKGFEDYKNEEATLFDIDNQVAVLGPGYRGDEYPDFNPLYINESKIPDKMRFKSIESSVDEVGDTVYLRWITQEDFDDNDASIFFDEVKRAYSEVAKHNNYTKPFKVVVQVTCRDGVEYGDAEADLEIKGE